MPNNLPTNHHFPVLLTAGEMAALSAIGREGFDSLDTESRSEVVGGEDARVDATNALATIRRTLFEINRA